MAGACKCDYPPPSRKDFALPKEDVQENAPSSAPSNQDELFNLLVDTRYKWEAQEESDSSLNSKHSPFPSCSLSEPELSSQGGPPENDENNCKRNEVFATDDHHYWTPVKTTTGSA
ncbi:uncharacterized protein LOC111318951 isoform X2 [Stylophora pistillata]|uniref:uncharacterized protein LOC111318951 isoform X2 n=1 Tax=Stylophora pistillata TaxID=50429 RepID=UPI000C041D2D|nr:uncharacterized protein LOC111318951 isoform X2 [Stylophora pistillata]